ncbi:MAG: hypothetical protein CMJ20_04685 [Phycisphaeraceae bacterium]|nr:hypothetical protein [Phycisphaeraceae bacterium]
MKREHLWVHHEQDATICWKLAEGGYAERMSVRQGELVTLCISNSRSYYDVFVFHEGAGRKLVKTIERLRGELQPVPKLGYQDGFSWKPVVSFTVPRDWKSGVYIASFATAQGVREILFVVRPAEPQAPLLLTLAANTYAAYNNVGGKSFYDYISTDRQHAKLVSFQRPLQPNMLGNFYIWDQFVTSWLEGEGYEVDYCVNADHDAEPCLLEAYSANMRIGHDEYNSVNECNQLQEFTRRGGNLLLFAGNAFCTLVEVRSGGNQLFCAKPHYHDPPTPEKPETSFLEFIDNQRQRTIGISYTSFVHAKTDRPGVFIAPSTSEFGFYRVVAPDHWAFEGTNLQLGDEFGREDSIVGVECDAAELEFVDGQPRYTGRDGVSPEYKVIALADSAVSGLIKSSGRKVRDDIVGEANAYATISVNETEFKGTIFNAATIEWGHGLYHDDSPVAIITRNVLNRLGKG